MSREDTIKLIELLTLYEDDCKAHQKSYNECESKLELSSQVMIANHIKVVNEIKEVLCFDL